MFVTSLMMIMAILQRTRVSTLLRRAIIVVLKAKHGFDSDDGEYILDYHPGPMSSNVTWPEFSDAKKVNRSNGCTAMVSTT